MFKTRSILTATGVLSVALLCGCGGTVKPVERIQSVNIRNSSHSVSGKLLREATGKAVWDVFHSAAFSAYLENYKKTSDGKIPLLRIGVIQNNTDDPDWQAALVSSQIADALFRARKVRVSDHDALLEIQRRKTQEENIRPDREDLLLSGVIAVNIDRAQNETYEVVVLNVRISELKTGENIWRYSTSFGTKRTKHTLGI